jgi:flagella basal body P-ring formation protein FlgA
MMQKLLRAVFFLALLLSLGVVHAENAGHGDMSIDMLRAAALAEAAKSLAVTPPRQHLEAGPIDSRLHLVACAAPIRSAAGPGLANRERMLVVLSCSRPKTWQVYVPVRVVGQGSALRTRRAVAAGEVLQAADLERFDLDVEKLPAGALDADAAVGKLTISHALAAGAILTTRDLIAARAVEKGQSVLLIGKGPVIEVKMAAVALDNAFINQRVKVKNASSGRIIEGYARAPGIVEVVLPGL